MLNMLNMTLIICLLESFHNSWIPFFDPDVINGFNSVQIKQPIGASACLLSVYCSALETKSQLDTKKEVIMMINDTPESRKRLPVSAEPVCGWAGGEIVSILSHAATSDFIANCHLARWTRFAGLQSATCTCLYCTRVFLYTQTHTHIYIYDFKQTYYCT